MNITRPSRLQRFLPIMVFFAVVTAHALYVRHAAFAPSEVWADSGLADNGFLGMGPYMQSQDYFTGFSYGLGTAFAAWAILQFIRQRRAAFAAGAVGSVTLVGVLMAAGCFLIGCCGSPMLGVYLSLFGAKALGAGKPLMALITLLSTGSGYFFLSRCLAKCGDVGRCY